MRIECVLVSRVGARARTLCASTQSGCAVRCRFCATGRMPCTKSLQGSEIAGQAIRSSRLLRLADRSGVTAGGIVLMGMGEPMLNYGSTVRALAVVAGCGLHGVRSARDITASTSGVAPALYRLCHDRPISLALSLHLHDGRCRRLLVPRGASTVVRSMMDSGCYYQRVCGMGRVTVEYCMARDVSDRQSQAEGLAIATSHMACMVNPILLNNMGGGVYSPPRRRSPAVFVQAAVQGRPAVTPRLTCGADVRAACGQLAA